jgi:hypothetical protein
MSSCPTGINLSQKELKKWTLKLQESDITRATSKQALLLSKKEESKHMVEVIFSQESSLKKKWIHSQSKKFTAESHHSCPLHSIRKKDGKHSQRCNQRRLAPKECLQLKSFHKNRLLNLIGFLKELKFLVRDHYFANFNQSLTLDCTHLLKYIAFRR